MTLAGCVEPDDGSSEPDDSNGDDSPATSGGPSAIAGPEWAADPAGETIIDRFSDDKIDRPECAVESETVEVGSEGEQETAETIPYPDSANYDGAPTYVEDFEEAYVTRDALCDRSSYILRVSYSVSERELREADDSTDIVYLLRYGGAASGVSDPGEPRWVSDLAPVPVAYAVDRTGIVRMELEDGDWFHNEESPVNVPDPRDEGTLVERFV